MSVQDIRCCYLARAHQTRLVFAYCRYVNHWYRFSINIKYDFIETCPEQNDTDISGTPDTGSDFEHEI